MLTAEQRVYAATCRSMLLDGYHYKGDAWGHAIAARCVWECGQVVADIHGRAQAVRMLDAVSDSINSMGMTSPVVEVEAAGTKVPKGMMMIAIPKNDADVDSLITVLDGMRGLWKGEST